MNGSIHLSTWVSQETKDRFGAIARELGLSESALLKRSVNLLLQGTSAEVSPMSQSAKVARNQRLYVRLRAVDQRLLSERAARRGMPAATYVSMLLRAHLQAVVPLPDREIDELKRAVGALGMVGRNLNQIAKLAHQTGKLGGPSVADLHALLRALQGLRDHIKELMQANEASWESGGD